MFTASARSASATCCCSPCFTQELETDDTGIRLVVANNRRQRCTAAVGALHLRLETATAAMLQHVKAAAAQLFGHTKGKAARRIALRHQIHIRRNRQRFVALILPQRQQAFDAHGEATGRRGLAAELRNQAVIAAAGANRALGAQLIGDPFEHGQVVVVEPAHQARIDARMNARILENGLHAFEMLERVLAQIVHQLGRGLDQRLHVRILGVEDAQRIAVQATLRIGIQLRRMLLEVSDQRGAMLLAFLDAAERIDFETYAFQAHRSSHSRAVIRICSASMSGPAKPRASTPIWWNWR